MLAGNFHTCMFAPHPAAPGPITGLGTGSVGFPPQLLPLSDKNTDWKKANMDSLETIGRMQYWQNLKLLENYRMANGQFMRHHYEDSPDNEFRDLLELIPEKIRSPIKLRHFDFSMQVINSMLGELESHPDTFHAVAKGEAVDSAREEEKARLLLQYVTEQVNQQIEAGLVQMGLDSQSDDPQVQQQVAEARKSLAPKEIQQYMATKWQHIAEVWSNLMLADNKEKFHHPEMEQVECRDMLLVDRCFRHFYLTGTGYQEETWNPIETFFHQSPEVSKVEKGNYVGRTYYLSLADVIDRFGHVMTGKELEELQGEYRRLNGGIQPKDWFGNSITYLSPEGLPYAHRLPTNNAWVYNNVPHVKDTTAGLNTDLLFQTYTGDREYSWYINNLYQITEGYWKSQKKIGKLVWFNPETGVLEKKLVDETVVLPDGIREVIGNLYGDPQEDEVNTIQWTWINEVWGGVKITPLANMGSIREPLYLNVKPLPFQGKPDIYLYEAELPVVGEVFNNRNAESQSMYDLMKPYQVAYNLFINQLYQMAETEILPFLLIDSNIIPNQKDWGGENGFVKWMESIRSSQIGIADTRPHVTNGANAGGQLPKVFDLSRVQPMMARYELARAMKQMALEQVGFNPQRLADIKANETATGVQEAIDKSYTQTATYFSRFYNYKKRCLQKGLDFSQFVQTRNKDITISATQSDFTQTYLKLVNTDLLTVQLHVYLVNSQEEQRKLKLIQQLGLDNTLPITTSSRIDMVSLTSIEKIKEVVKQAEQQAEQQQVQAQQLEQQKIESAERMQQSQQDWQAEQNQLDRESEERQAYIKTFGYGTDATADTDQSGVPDALEFDKLNQKAQSDAAKQNLAERKFQHDQTKLVLDQQDKQADREVAVQKMQNDRIIQEKKIEQAQILGDKSR